MGFDLTVSDYARHRGCDEKAVRKAIAEGRITAIGEGRGRRIDPEVADIQWAKNTRARADSARVAPPPAATPTAPPAAQPAADAIPGATGGYNDHRARREKAEADRAELEVMREARELVRREPGERAVMQLFRVLRDACLAANQTTALKLLGLVELREIKLVLDDGYRDAFGDAEQRIREWMRSQTPDASAPAEAEAAA